MNDRLLMFISIIYNVIIATGFLGFLKAVVKFGLCLQDWFLLILFFFFILDDWIMSAIAIDRTSYRPNVCYIDFVLHVFSVFLLGLAILTIIPNLLVALIDLEIYKLFLNNLNNPSLLFSLYLICLFIWNMIYLYPKRRFFRTINEVERFHNIRRLYRKVIVNLFYARGILSGIIGFIVLFFCLLIRRDCAIFNWLLLIYVIIFRLIPDTIIVRFTR